MKKVFSSNSELIHIWANNEAPEVYKRANSVSCQYDRLYSYNTCIAEIVGDTVILNKHSFSNSTSKHQSLAISAVHGLKRLLVDIPLWNNSRLVYGQRDFDELIVSHNEKLAAEYLVKASRARKNSDYFNGMAYAHLNSLAEYAALVGLEYKAGDLSELQAAAIEADKIRKEREKIRKAEKIQEEKEALEKWRIGEFNGWRNFEVTALRINGDQVETSKGAKIPLDHAIKAWPLFSRIIKSGETFYPQGHAIHLGHYQVRKADKNELIVGCHNIPMSEVLNIAKQLNLKGA